MNNDKQELQQASKNWEKVRRQLREAIFKGGQVKHEWINTSENHDLKMQRRDFDMLSVQDRCEEYLAGIISKEDLIGELQKLKMNNFKITELLADLDKIKVL